MKKQTRDKLDRRIKEARRKKSSDVKADTGPMCAGCGVGKIDGIQCHKCGTYKSR